MEVGLIRSFYKYLQLKLYDGYDGLNAKHIRKNRMPYLEVLKMAWVSKIQNTIK